MLKKCKDLVKGDIIRVEYGDYDNWVTVIVDRIEDTGDTYCKIVGKWPNSQTEVEMWGKNNSMVEILERV